MKVAVRDQQNRTLREVDLVDEVFGYPLRIPLIHEAVTHFQAKGRRGTASTKTRGEVQGSGRKPWRQKKTGRARAGSVRSPLWRHGGTVFGPRPRDYDFLFPRRKGRNALRSVLSQKVREGNLILVDDLSLPEPKTRLLAAMLQRMELRGKTLIVDAGENRNLFLAARNHPRCQAVTWGEVNVFNLLAHETVLISEPALGRLTQVFRP